MTHIIDDENRDHHRTDSANPSTKFPRLPRGVAQVINQLETSMEEIQRLGGPTVSGTDVSRADMSYARC